MSSRLISGRLRRAVVGLAVVALAIVLTPAVAADNADQASNWHARSASASNLRVSELEVEHQVTPLGIDDSLPRFGWVLTAKGDGVRQQAYQIQVSTTRSGPADVWDSGKTMSSRSFDVEYDGLALDSRTRYFWKVRVWNEAGQVSRWSRTTWFETAFLTPDEFKGRWIGARETLPDPSFEGANWIWYREGNPADSAPTGTRYFRRAFDLPADEEVRTATLQLTADDAFTVYVNGEEIASSPSVQDSWRTATVTEIASDLRPGRNVIAIEAVNRMPGPAGVIAKLEVEGSGAPVVLVTDDEWVTAQSAADGWYQPEFDDSTWARAMEAAPYGAGPWGSSVSAPVPPEPLLRKEFSADKPIESARVYVAGLGYYKLFLNGNRIGDRELDPGFTVYDETVLYSTYDVTDALRTGDNAVGVSLGRGYYAMTRPDEWKASPWHSEPKLKLELDITYRDGTTRRIVTDDAWKTADGPTRTESLWFGETYDARLEQPGWTSSGFDDADWRAAQLVTGPEGDLTAQQFPPIKVTEQLPLGDRTNPKPGVHVYDFKSPTAGWAEVAVSGAAGAEVRITYGEKLHDDGTVNNTGAFGMQLQAYTYILNGKGMERYRPSYSYAGFRYVQVEVPAGVEIESVTGERVHSAVAPTGDFHSSSDLLNRYHEAQANSILNNLHSVPTDTPMYEKRPYTADGHLISDSAIASFDMQSFFANWMRAHRDDQTAEGTIGHTVPATEGGKKVIDPVWSASFVLINWDLYWYYGDTRVISKNYDAMKAWLTYFEDEIAKTGNIYTGFTYGDWLAPEGTGGTRLVGTAYIHKTATTMAKIAAALDHDEDAERFTRLASSIADAFNAEFYDEASGAYYDDATAGYRQTANLLPLSFGIVPDEHQDTVVASLVEDIQDRGYHLNTGALGTKAILPVLTDIGRPELAYDVATNPTYPGWGYWFQQLGATTMWEEWNAESRSHDHAFLGTVDDWLYQRVAGIEPAAPGYSKVRIKPYPVGPLKTASAHVESPLGRVSTNWRRSRGVFMLRARVPVGATADVFVPARNRRSVKAPSEARFLGMEGGYAEFNVGSGHHRFRVLKRGPHG
ncbi:MAG: glycoside hydrolase family 78 protein [Actinomycetia bacterium]|nr:glycoside hydrolase family 78 protein [Actinomycetes bacterium]